MQGACGPLGNLTSGLNGIGRFSEVNARAGACRKLPNSESDQHLAKNERGTRFLTYASEINASGVDIAILTLSKI
jgi:hypothetical protein